MAILQALLTLDFAVGRENPQRGLRLGGACPLRPALAQGAAVPYRRCSARRRRGQCYFSASRCRSSRRCCSRSCRFTTASRRGHPLVWLGLALFVPVFVGLVVASKAPAGSMRESFWMRLARGWPITIGLAASFLVMFVTVPAPEDRVVPARPPAGAGAARDAFVDLSRRRSAHPRCAQSSWLQPAAGDTGLVDLGADDHLA